MSATLPTSVSRPTTCVLQSRFRHVAGAFLAGARASEGNLRASFGLREQKGHDHRQEDGQQRSRAICVIFITLQNFFGTALEKG
jgi:hypothetical protein